MYVRELVVSLKRRRTVRQAAHGQLVNTPATAAAVLHTIIGHEVVEVFVVLALNTRNRLNAFHLVSRGSISATLVGPREVFQAALLAHSSTIIVGHNHPSGDPTPSAEDLALTRRLVAAGELLGVVVSDHIIVGHDGRFFSFLESGGMNALSR